MNLEHTEVKFWGGLRTIGGTIISVQYKDARVIFDYGLIFSPASSIFDGKIKERNVNTVHDYVKLGLVPPIDGVYEKSDIAALDGLLSVEEDNRETAVIISHLHLDHMGGMGMLSPQIPVYLTDETVDLYETLETIGEKVPGHRPNLKKCYFHETFQVGEIKITPIPIDHDVIGACGFHIATPDGAIFYTGDFRLHGRHPELIEQAITKAKELAFDVLIMEGTTLQDIEESKNLIVPDATLPDQLTKEKEVVEKMQAILQETTGLGLFNIYHRNVERVQDIIALKNTSGRKVVFELETAYVADQLLDSKDFAVYVSADTKMEHAAGTLPEWKQALLEKYEHVEAKDMNANPAGYFVQTTYENSLELLDWNVENGAYIHANGTPLGDYDPAYHNLLKLLKYIGLERFVVGTGGHAMPQHLKYVLEKLDPKILVPLHSFHPERLVPDNGRLLLPEYNATYIINEHNMHKQ